MIVLYLILFYVEATVHGEDDVDVVVMIMVFFQCGPLPSLPLGRHGLRGQQKGRCLAGGPVLVPQHHPTACDDLPVLLPGVLHIVLPWLLPGVLRGIPDVLLAPVPSVLLRLGLFGWWGRLFCFVGFLHDVLPAFFTTYCFSADHRRWSFLPVLRHELRIEMMSVQVSD